MYNILFYNIRFSAYLCVAKPTLLHSSLFIKILIQYLLFIYIIVAVISNFIIVIIFKLFIFTDQT